MTKTERLLSVFSESVKAGGGIHTVAELAYMMGEKNNHAFVKFLSDATKKSIVGRVAKGLYESALTPPEPSTAIYKIAKKLRHDALTYISLESQLSSTGDISQVMMGRVTLMTKGRAGVFETPYGTIEFTHTKKPLEQIAPNLYFDPDIKMYRAKTEQAVSDLKNCKRNMHMLEGIAC